MAVLLARWRLGSIAPLLAGVEQYSSSFMCPTEEESGMLMSSVCKKNIMLAEGGQWEGESDMGDRRSQMAWGSWL
jgi:hypothetical protein